MSSNHDVRIADASAGNLQSLPTYPLDSAVSYVVRSRSFGTEAERPVLSIAAIREPATLTLLDVTLAFCRRKTRLDHISW